MTRPSVFSCTGRILALAAIASAIPFATSGAQAPAELRARFIGNMAFAITDGETTLFTDFPYRSGAFGYMRYDLAAVEIPRGAITLVTHEHADHWDPELFRGTGLRVIAHPAITSELPPDSVLSWQPAMRLGEIEVTPVRSPHTEAHSSYLVRWHGRRLYFTGDTESTSELLAQRGLDVAFVSPWLVRAVIDSGARIDAELVVVYHHTASERLPARSWLHVPLQGESI